MGVSAVNFKEMNACYVSQEAFDKMRSNISQNADGTPSFLLIHPERTEAAYAELKKKKEHADKLQRIILKQLEELQDQIDWHTGEIAKIDKELDALKTDKDLLERGELPEKGADGKYNSATEKAIKEWEKKNGKKLDRDDPDAILAAILEREAILRAARADHERKIDGLEKDKNDIKAAVKTGDPEIVQKVLDEKGIEETYYASTDINLAPAADTVLNDRRSKGEEVKTNTSIQAVSKDNLSASFLGKATTFAQSAKDMNVTSGFNGAADGQMMVAEMQIEEPQQIIARPNIISNEMMS